MVYSDELGPYPVAYCEGFLCYATAYQTFPDQFLGQNSDIVRYTIAAINLQCCQDIFSDSCCYFGGYTVMHKVSCFGCVSVQLIPTFDDQFRY